MESDYQKSEQVKKMEKIAEDFLEKHRGTFDRAVKYSQMNKLAQSLSIQKHRSTFDKAIKDSPMNKLAQSFSEVTIPDATFRKVLNNINNQMESFQHFISDLEKKVPENIAAEFKYIEEYGLPNGFAYTAYISSGDQCNLIKAALSTELSEEDTLKNIRAMRSDFEYRVIDRLVYGKDLAKLHFENIFNGNPKLSIHYLVVLVEEILKCYKKSPSTNKFDSKQSRRSIKDSSTHYRDKMIEAIDSNYHSVELVKKSYDEVLIDQFYMTIDKENPSELSFVNRNDVVHVYSDMDRYNLLDIYKILLLISSVLDLLEIMDIVKGNK